MTSKGLEDAPNHTFGVGAYGLVGEGVGRWEVFVCELGILKRLGFIFLLFWKSREKGEGLAGTF